MLVTQNEIKTFNPISEHNFLLKAATPLITLITQITHTVDQKNVPALRAQVIEEIKNFERRLTSVDYPLRTIVAARYCLCTAIDEAVLSREWGGRSIWLQESLLNLFQKETWGGERFYIILDDMIKNVRENIDFLELIYYLLSLGYEGKFYGNDNRSTREEIRNRIFYNIRQTRSKPGRTLSAHWKITSYPVSNKDKKRVLMKSVIFITASILILGLYYNLRTWHMAEPTLKRLSKIATTSPVTTYMQVTGLSNNVEQKKVRGKDRNGK